MICPRTKGNCGCNCAADCMLAPVAVAVGPFNLFTSPPPPTLAEIERLVDAYGSARAVVALYGHSESALVAAKAALMAAIRLYGRDDGLLPHGSAGKT